MKEQQYQMLVSQIASLIEGESDEIAVMSNVVAAIHQEMRFWWTGFYRAAGDELLLGPFQGPVACMHIPFGRGVCGAAWQRRETIIVPDVEQFPGHIACSSASRSEIVVRACCLLPVVRIPRSSSPRCLRRPGTTARHCG